MADGGFDVAGTVKEAATQYGVDPDFALRVAQAESSLNPASTSPKGAVGVMQLMPKTAKGLGVDPHDVRQNIIGGVKYLRQLSDKYGGDQHLTAAAYNAGPGSVDKHGGVPPFPETVAYVAKTARGANDDGPSLDELQARLTGGQPAPTPVEQSRLPNVPGYIDNPANAPGETGAIPIGGPGQDSEPSLEELQARLGGGGQPAAAETTQAPIAPQGVTGALTGFLSHVNRGLGIGDELAAGVNTLGDVVTGKSGPDIGQTFKDEMGRQRGIEAGYRQAHPNLSALGEGLGMAATVAAPGMGEGGALRGVAAAGSRAGNVARGVTLASLTSAGFAAADAGTPQERLAAASKAAVNPLVLAFGAGSGALAPTASKAVNAMTGVPSMAEKVAAFDSAGVTPTLAAVGGRGYATVAKTAAENPIAGLRARTALTGSIDETQGAASRIAEEYGTALPRASAGEAAQQAIADYSKGTGAQLPPDLARQLSSRDISFGDKAGALYTRAERLIGDKQPILVPNTTKAIEEVMGTFQSPALAQRFKNSVLSGIGKDLATTGGQIPWSDAKNLRTSIRERLMGDPQLSGTVSDAQVGKIYGALTQDMRDGAEHLGGAKAARAWDQANTFYKVGKQQIDNQLTKIFDAPNGEAAYDSIIRSAGSKGGADIQKLLASKRAMGDGWGDVAATAAQRLGADEHGAFSVNKFVTNYANLSDSGRQALFGSLGGGGAKATALKLQLDNLSKVAEMQKHVEAAANHSKTAVSAQTLATMGGLMNPATTIPTLKLLGGLALTGEAMTNPTVVRWLSGLARSKTPEALATTTQALGLAAQKNPALGSLYRAVISRSPRVAGVYGTGTSGTPSVASPPNALAGVSP